MNYTIVEWNDKYAKDLIALSYEWLEKYVKVEQHDLDMIEHPHEAILDGGGMVWFALDGESVVGTVSVINCGGSVYELAKLSVTERCKGNGIGNALVERAVNYCKGRDCKKMLLYTNSILLPAIKTYKRYGFVEKQVEQSAYETADVYMELTFE